MPKEESSKVVFLSSGQWLPWLLVLILVVAGIFGYSHYSGKLDEKDEKLQTHERQMRGELTKKEIELQSLNKELHLAKSQLLKQDDLEEFNYEWDKLYDWADYNSIWIKTQSI